MQANKPQSVDTFNIKELSASKFQQQSKSAMYLYLYVIFYNCLQRLVCSVTNRLDWVLYRQVIALFL